MKKRVISTILILSMLICNTATLVYAEPTDEEKQKIEEGTTNLSAAEKELKTVGEKLSKISTEIDISQAEIESNKAQLLKIQKNIEISKVEIDVLKSDIKDKEGSFGERLNSIYKAGGKNSYLQILLSSDSISDFIGRAGALNTILDLDKTAIEDLTSKKDQLDRKIEKLDSDTKKIKELEVKNNEKIEEEKKQKTELDKLYADYETKLNSADVDLASYEKSLYKYWSDIIGNSKSSKSDLENAIKSLKDIKGQLKSKKAQEDIDSLIKTAETNIKKKLQQQQQESVNVNINGIATGTAADIISYGTGFLGRPYVSGGNGPDKFDCSGFTKYVYGRFGIALPRISTSQMTQGRAVSRNNLLPGDLIVTEGGGHVGIYVGNNQMLHAANSRQGVIISSIWNFHSARRLL